MQEECGSLGIPIDMTTLELLGAEGEPPLSWIIGKLTPGAPQALGLTLLCNSNTKDHGDQTGKSFTVGALSGAGLCCSGEVPNALQNVKF